MNKRLAMLEKMVASGQADSFARYALGMEYRKEGRTVEAVATFTDLRAADPDYVAQYLMAGTMLLEASRGEEGRAWLEAGLVVAQRTGNSHALGELQSALDGASNDSPH